MTSLRTVQVAFVGITIQPAVRSMVTEVQPMMAIEESPDGGTVADDGTTALSVASAPVTLTLDLTGTGTGTVTSSPAGLAVCSGSAQTCLGTFESGTFVTLTASPASGHEFTGWSGACTGTASPCTVTLAGARYVAAHFRVIPAMVTRFYHVDTLGSVRAVTNAAGAETRRDDYHAFGEAGSPPQGDSIRFTGKERDAETALDYFGARYYRTLMGRFITVDPVRNVDVALVDPQQWNRYAYAKNGPTRYIDPDGRQVQLAVDRSRLEATKKFREYISSKLGGGLVADIVDAMLAQFAPATEQEMADGILASAMPAAMVTGGAGKLARAFGFTDFVEAGSLVGGKLTNGGTAAVSFAREGGTLAINISMASGPRGTLAALEAGAIRAATSEGASALRLVATNVSESMARLLKSKGFSQKGKSGTWVKLILVND